MMARILIKFAALIAALGLAAALLSFPASNYRASGFLTSALRLCGILAGALGGVLIGNLASDVYRRFSIRTDSVGWGSVVVWHLIVFGSVFGLAFGVRFSSPSPAMGLVVLSELALFIPFLLLETASLLSLGKASTVMKVGAVSGCLFVIDVIVWRVFGVLLMFR